MRLLIIGICSFVGSSLARGFRQSWPGWEISGLDNLVLAGSEINRGALRRLGVRVFHGDIRNPSDLLTLIAAQVETPAANAPRVLNVSGGLGNSASLRELSAWCQRRFGPHTVSAETVARPFDVPWLVLNSARAAQTWSWRPQTSLEAVWSEIADQADQDSGWLDQVSEL